MISSSLVTDEATRNSVFGIKRSTAIGESPSIRCRTRRSRDDRVVCRATGIAWDIENLQSIFDCIEGLEWLPSLPTGPKVPTSGSTESFRATRSFCGFCPGNPIRLSRGKSVRWGEATDKEQRVGWEQATGRRPQGIAPPGLPRAGTAVITEPGPVEWKSAIGVRYQCRILSGPESS